MANKKIGYGNFYCWNCGNNMQKGHSQCPSCGAYYEGNMKYGNIPLLQAGGIGWSDKIDDPRFKAYAQKSKKASIIFLSIISIIIPVIILLGDGFELNSDMLIVIPIVLAIVWLFGLGFLFFKYGKAKPDWDGIVEDKQTKQKTRHNKNTDHRETYTEYTIIFRKQNGQKEIIKSEQPMIFHTYAIGEHVHYHGGKYCRGIEKYDKSHVTELACFACGSLNDARNNYCERCGCPILKGQPVSNTSNEQTNE